VFRKNNGFIVFVRVKFYDGKDELKPNSMVSLPPKEGDDYSRLHNLFPIMGQTVTTSESLNILN
ncbi:isochorismatase, partial [Staphylococcus aureus]|nr:isochorismatase [Staphylococcus aureus]